MRFYQINSKDVSSEYFDNEVLAINLKSGSYYSLRFSAYSFWKLLNEGHSYEHTIELLSNHYNQDPSILNQSFEEFLNQLISNELLEPSTEQKNLPSNEWLAIVAKEFNVPQLECYTDMQDLLLFDPIHDVDTNVGWPKKSEEDSIK